MNTQTGTWNLPRTHQPQRRRRLGTAREHLFLPTYPICLHWLPGPTPGQSSHSFEVAATCVEPYSGQITGITILSMKVSVEQAGHGEAAKKRELSSQLWASATSSSFTPTNKPFFAKGEVSNTQPLCRCVIKSLLTETDGMTMPFQLVSVHRGTSSRDRVQRVSASPGPSNTM